MTVPAQVLAAVRSVHRQGETAVSAPESSEAVTYDELCNANCHLHGQGAGFHVATCDVTVARDRLAAALWPAATPWGRTKPYDQLSELHREVVDRVLSVVQRLAVEKAVAELRAAAEDVDLCCVRIVTRRADALVPAASEEGT